MNNTTQQLEAIQRMMLVPDSAALQDNVRSFWDIQDQVLDAMENFTNGWFERRHVGTHTALEAAQRMCKAQTPVDLVREYQEWVGGAFQRVMADGFACQQFVGAFAGPLSGKQEPKPQQPETKTASIPKQRDLAQHFALETSQGGSTVRAYENPARRVMPRAGSREKRKGGLRRKST
jgi:hypothetical protein